MKIKKASPGLDQRNRLGKMLGSGYVVGRATGEVLTPWVRLPAGWS